jgi:hypothetical protein
MASTIAAYASRPVRRGRRRDADVRRARGDDHARVALPGAPDESRRALPGAPDESRRDERPADAGTAVLRAAMFLSSISPSRSVNAWGHNALTLAQ